MTVSQPMREDRLAALLTPARRLSGLWVPRVGRRDVLAMASGRAAFVTVPWERALRPDGAAVGALLDRLWSFQGMAIARPADRRTSPRLDAETWSKLGRRAVRIVDLVIVPCASLRLLADEALVADLERAMASNKPVLWMGPDVAHGAEVAA